jgi:phthalate 4,5-cis-dihydrodiol dehydrogenase
VPEIEELLAALDHGTPALHSGEWGMATLEVCLAIMQSGREHRDVLLKYQVSVPDGY